MEGAASIVTPDISNSQFWSCFKSCFNFTGVKALYVLGCFFLYCLYFLGLQDDEVWMVSSELSETETCQTIIFLPNEKTRSKIR